MKKTFWILTISLFFATNAYCVDEYKYNPFTDNLDNIGPSGTGTGNPGGTGTQIQYRVDSVTFGGVPDSSYNVTTQTIGTGTLTLSTAGATRLTIEGTSTNSATEPLIECYHNKTAADSDDLCNNIFSGNDSLGTKTSYNILFSEATTVADGSETGRMLLQNRILGSMQSVWEATSSGTFQVHQPIDVDSGTIDGTTIGSSSAADATFTAVTVDGSSSQILGGNGYALDFNTATALEINSTGFEDILIDLETTSNTLLLTSTTGLNEFDFGSIGVDVNGGTIDGTKIGASSAADATFSQVTVGTGAAGVNYQYLKVDGETYDMSSTWFEDEVFVQMLSNISSTDVGFVIGPASTVLKNTLAAIAISSGASSFGISGSTVGIGFIESNTSNPSTMALITNPGSNITSGTSLGIYAFAGRAGDSLPTSSNISSFATENWTNDGGGIETATGSDMRFYTVPNTTIVGVERMRITNDGKIGVANTSPTYTFDVTGSIRASGSITSPNVSVTTTNTGGNAGTDLCIDANNRLCACGSCA